MRVHVSKNQRPRVACAVFVLSAVSLMAANESSSPVLEAMKAELSRSMVGLKDQPVPPYFLSYEVTETERTVVSAAFGALRASFQNRTRQLDVDLRVGNYSFDNTRPVRGRFGRGGFGGRTGFVSVPIDDDSEAIRSVLWRSTDSAYRRAVEEFMRLQSNLEVMVAAEDRSGDFSREEPLQLVEPVLPVQVDRAVWEQKVRKYSAPFSEYGNIFAGSVSLSVTGETRWHVSSEGSEIRTSQPYYRLVISAYTKADDGMELPRYESFFAAAPDGLPNDEEVLGAVRKVIEDLQALRQAPIVDPYTGPAILSGRASGVFFHEVFGHRIEGHRQKVEDEGQTFRQMVEEQLLPESFSIYFDPTLNEIGGVDLAGHYRVDNQGIQAQRVPVLLDGVFKNFLMSRTPIEGFAHSNGHGRKQAGFRPVARQSNLIVESAEPLSTPELRDRLIELLEKEDKPFGLLFEDIQGGFTQTGRRTPNAFNVLPILVYRIYRDGRQELVRGVDLIGTPLTAFSKVVAAGNEVEVFNGTCGAESGAVPVSAASPQILISQIEVQKKAKSQERSPILPAPFEEKKLP